MAEKKIGKRLLLRTSFWYVLSMFLTRGMVFITMPIFTRLLSKEDYGNFYVYVTWQQILLIICSVELHGTLNRARFDFPEKKEFQSYIASTLCLSSFITAAFFIIYLAFPHTFDSFFLLDKKYIYILFLYLLFVPALNTFQSKQRVEYRYKTSSAISISLAVLSPILSMALVLLMKDSDPLYGRIIGQYSLHIVVGIIFYAYFIINCGRIHVGHWKYAVSLGLPLVFNYLSSKILLSGDTLILKHMCSPVEVSYLSVTHTTSHIISVLVQTLNIAWAPWLYDMLKVNKHAEVRKVFRVFLWGMILATAAVLLVGPEVIYILGGPGYKDSVYLLPPNILCGAFAVLTSHCVNIETYYNKQHYAAILTGSVAILNVVLNIIGVKLFGYMAVCYTTVLSQLILVLLHYHVTRSMGIRKMISVRMLFLALLTMLALIPFALLLYQSNPVRFIVLGISIAIVIIIGIYKRNELASIAQKLLKSRKKEQSNE